MKIFLVAALAALAWTGLAQASSQTPALQARLPVSEPVYCADTPDEWNTDPYGGQMTLGYTFVTGPHQRDIHLSNRTCLSLLAGPTDGYFALAAATLYHEWWHSVTLDRDEGRTECVSLYFYRYALRHFWNLSPRDSQFDYEMAVSGHQARAQSFSEYGGDCTFPQDDPLI